MATVGTATDKVTGTPCIRVTYSPYPHPCALVPLAHGTSDTGAAFTGPALLLVLLHSPGKAFDFWAVQNQIPGILCGSRE